MVSWTALVSAFSQLGNIEEVAELFKEMQWASIKPNDFTFTSLISACYSLEALEQGKLIHAHVIRTVTESYASMGNALATMYARCGDINDAFKVFSSMFEWDVVSWSAMIPGYALHAHGKEALELFLEMLFGNAARRNKA